MFKIRSVLICVLLFGVGLLGIVGIAMNRAAAAAAEQEAKAAASKGSDSNGPMIAHMVFFALKECNDENRKKLVDAAKEYLGGHPGEVYFSVGTMVNLGQPVNVTDFDVALHIVFVNKAAHDEYLVSERHKKFVAIATELDKSVRVFDSELVPLVVSAAK